MSEPEIDPDFMMADKPKPVPEEDPLPPAVKAPQFPIRMDRVDTAELQLFALQMTAIQLMADKRQKEITQELQELQRQHVQARQKFDAKAQELQQRYGVDVRHMNINEEGVILGPLPGKAGG